MSIFIPYIQIFAVDLQTIYYYKYNDMDSVVSDKKIFKHCNFEHNFQIPWRTYSTDLNQLKIVATGHAKVITVYFYIVYYFYC